MAEKFDGFQVLVAAVLVGNPLAVFAAIVQIEHGGNRIDTQAVYMELLDPVERVGDQEVGNLVLFIVENFGAPVRMLAFSWVRVLKEGLPVEICKAVCIPREVCWNPVQNDADAFFVHVVYEVFKLLRRAVTGGRGIIAGYLITPGAIVRMFGNTHKLHVGVAHIFDVSGELCGCLFIGIVTIFFRAVFLFPGAQMHLINAHGRFTRIGAFPFLYPGSIAPAEEVVKGGDGSRTRPIFCVLGKRIGLEDDFAGLGRDGKFIKLSRLDARNETFVNTGGFQYLHWAGIRIPVVEVAYNTDGCGMRSPDRKIIAVLPLIGFRVRTELVIDLIMGTFSEEITVTGGDKASFRLLFLISDCHKVNPP